MYIGLDIGGSNISASIFDEQKKLITTAKVKSKAKEETEVVVGQLFKVIDKLIAEILTGKKLVGIGIEVAGLIDKKTSIVRRSGNINFNGVNLRQLIQDKYAVKSEIDNDVNVEILGEAKYGAGVGCDDIIGAFVGTGIGGGLVLNSKLYTGNSGLAAELGHTILSKKVAHIVQIVVHKGA